MRGELRNYDWKMMILHFLGLDHIGHVEGPFSDKVPLKLQEMDNITNEIYQAMKIWVRSINFICPPHALLLRYYRTENFIQNRY